MRGTRIYYDYQLNTFLHKPLHLSAVSGPGWKDQGLTPGKKRNFVHRFHVQFGYGAHAASYPKNIIHFHEVLCLSMPLRYSYEHNLPHMRTDGVKCLNFLFPYSLTDLQNISKYG